MEVYGVNAHLQPTTARFWVRWILATAVGIVSIVALASFGFVVALALTFSWPPGYTTGLVVGGALGGLLLGFAQRYVLRLYLRRFDARVWATGGGVAAGMLLFMMVSMHIPSATDIGLLETVLSGTAVGIVGTFQWLVSRRTLPWASTWLIPNVAAGLVGWAVRPAVGVIVYVAGTGAVLQGLLSSVRREAAGEP